MSMRRPGATMKSAEKSLGLRVFLLIVAIVALAGGSFWFFSLYGKTVYNQETKGGSPLKDLQTIRGK